MQTPTLLAVFAPGRSQDDYRQQLENVLASAAFDQRSAALFLDSAIELLCESGQPEIERQRAPFRTFQLYGVAPVYVCGALADHAGFAIDVQPVTRERLPDLIAGAKFVQSA